MTIKAVVTDIEGTITDIAFVKDVLFPYALEHIGSYIRAHASDAEVANQLAAVAEECHCEPVDLDAITRQLIRWIDEDRKATPLKALQGRIWRAGYEDGSLRGHLYPDVLPVLRQWQDSGLSLYVYSSGSIAAQKLLFGHSVDGDITPLFKDYFDTTSGPKQQPESYARIAAAIAVAPQQLLFLSDHPAELVAAGAAGWEVAQLIRPGNTPDGRFPAYADLNEVAQDPRLQP